MIHNLITEDVAKKQEKDKNELVKAAREGQKKGEKDVMQKVFIACGVYGKKKIIILYFY